MLRLLRSLRWYASAFRHATRNWLAVQRGTRGAIFFARELKFLLGVDDRWLRQTAREYRQHPNAWRRLGALRSASRGTDGYAKTLDIAEGFAVWALVKHRRPRILVELGTQRGLSARLWKDALSAYVPDHRLYVLDIEDSRAFIRDGEAEFMLGDARQTLPEIIARERIDLLFNDAHPYDLIKWSIQTCREAGTPCFVFHDVGIRHPRAVFKPETGQVPVAERMAHADDIHTYGHWERHVLAELYGPRVLDEDSLQFEDARLQIFDSLFGVGVLLLGD